jgi:hypothetical protein
MVKNLVVSESEQYPEEPKKHYLYNLVPISVKIKVFKILESGIDPILFDKEQQELLDDLLSDADILLFPDKKNFPKVKEIYDALTDAIAKLAFVPCGVEIFGYRYEVI